MCEENKTVLLCDGEFELLRVKEDLFDEVMEFYQSNYVNTEPFSVALKIPNNERAKKDVDTRVRAALEDEISFALRHCATKEIVALRVNKIMSNLSKPNNIQYQSPAVIYWEEVMQRLRSSFDLSKEWNINCAWQLCGINVRKDFCKRGLATILTNYSVEFARQMLNGTLPEIETLPSRIRNLKPKAVCSICSSKFAQKVGEKLGFEVLVTIPFEDLFYEGKSLADLIDPIHKCFQYVAMRL